MTSRPTAELLERRSLLAIDVTVPQVDLTADPNLLVNSLAGSGDGAGSTVVAWSDRNTSTGLGNEVFLRRFNANGALGAAVQVNTTTSGVQQGVDVATNASGRSVVVWESAGQDGSGYGIYARIYDAAGTALTGEIAINQTTAGDQRTPSVAIDPSGKFVVAWLNGDRIAARQFAANGTAAGNEFAVGPAFTLGTADPKVAMLGDGRFAVAFAGGDTSSDIKLQAYAANGATAGSLLTVNTATTGEQVQPAIATVGNNFVVAWADGSAGEASIYFRVVGATGSAVTAATQASQDSDGNRVNPQVLGDAAGNFTIGWTRQQSGAVYSTADYRVYDSTFVATSNETPYGDGSSARTLFDLVRLGNGAFRDVSTIGENLYAGVAISASFANVIVLDGTSGADNVVGYDLNATTLRAAVNGVAADYLKSAYAYIRADLGAGNDKWDTKASTMPTTIKGGDGDDRIFTGDGRDSVSGGEGHDYISTAGENDYVIGDRGDDSIYGGDGADTLTGSAGGNRLYGGNGNDRLKGSNGRDFLYGEGNDDRLEGGGGNDYLDGGGNKDRVWGGDGDDSLIGGGSVDRLYGEAGRDTLYGNDANDYLSGGPGVDVLYGGAGNDTDLDNDSSDILDSVELHA